MGATIGVTVMGVIVNHGLPRGVAAGGEAAQVHRLPPALRSGLAGAIHPAFLVAACISAAVWVIAVLFVKEQPLRRVGRRGRRGRRCGRYSGGGCPRITYVSDDFMPLDGWDHVELWVGNAKQAAYYYEHAFGFACTSYAGPETGVRDRASYVLEQSEIRLVISSSLRRGHEIGDFAVLHGDGVKDISLRVPDANEAYRQAVQRGARGIMEPKAVEDEFGKVVLATIGTYGDVVHTFVDRHAYEGAYLPGYVAPRAVAPKQGSGCSRSTTSSGTSSSAACSTGSSSTSGSSA